MKFTKDQIQKAFLAGMLGVGGLYYYAFEMMGPLSDRRVKAEKEITTLEGKIKEAKSQITRTKSIEDGDVNAATARRVYEEMKAKIPDAQPVAWLPPRLSEFFTKQSLARPAFHFNSDGGSDFPGFRLSSWGIEISGASFTALGTALSSLENQEGLLQVTNIQIEAVPKEPESSHAKLIISTLVKSEK